MIVVHLSAECYPIAKAGGLGDVVGALPKYQCKAGINAQVVMPWYNTKAVDEHTFKVVYEGAAYLGSRPFQFQILKESKNSFGFQLYLVHIPGLLDRDAVYGYEDETEQFTAFQLAFLQWADQLDEKPDIIHCHDHHTGLIPFLMYHSKRYSSLSQVPTVLTVHNAQYQGWFSWDKADYLPEIDPSENGLLDWNGVINPLAAGIKCCWRFTAVSQSYLDELSFYSNGLEYLFAGERQKGIGIINGIDTEVWNPETDSMITANYAALSAKKGKQENKKAICKEFGLAQSRPLIAFIGRLVGEKGAELLPQIIEQSLIKHNSKVNFLILGSGEPDIEEALKALLQKFKKNVNVFIGYNEALSHRIYAAADFLLMPSRVEPCGLNQLYSFRYGTIPIVRRTGGLKDTVVDIDEENGYGLCFQNLTAEEASEAVARAEVLYTNSRRLQLLRKQVMGFDFSWDRSANQYIELYKTLI